MDISNLEKSILETKLGSESILVQIKTVLLSQDKPLKDKIKQLLNDEILNENIQQNLNQIVH